MIRLINKLANNIMGRNLSLNEEMPLGYLIGILIQRIGMIIRGMIVGLFLGEKGKAFFVGKSVTIRCRKKLKIGRSVSLQDYVLIDALSIDGITLGDNVSIGIRSMIKTSGSLGKLGKGMKMGHDSAMGNDCFVGAAGGVFIGDYVAIGQNVRFHSENHEFSDRNKLISEQGVSNKGIIIGNDCWLGAGAVFLDGVTVGKGCVIGANSLVTHDIPAYSIAVGSPARVIGERQ